MKNIQKNLQQMLHKREENYFNILNMPITLFQNINDLEKNFVLAMKEVHPDKHIRKNIGIIDITSKKSAVLNKAFETLSSSIKTLEYIIDDNITINDFSVIEYLMNLNQKVVEIQKNQEKLSVTENNNEITELNINDNINDKNLTSLKILQGELKIELLSLLKKAEHKITTDNYQDLSSLFMKIKGIEKIIASI